jgi:hypothetical protein
LAPAGMSGGGACQSSTLPAPDGISLRPLARSQTRASLPTAGARQAPATWIFISRYQAQGGGGGAE